MKKTLFIIMMAVASISKAQLGETDTIKVWMLISDTTAKTKFLYDDDHYAIITVVVKGYQVRELRNAYADEYGTNFMGEGDYYKHIKFLTEKKKNIPKGWIVWQCK